MYKQVLEGVSGISIWPIIAMLIFMAVFTAIFVWAMRLDKSTVKELANLPLQEKRPFQSGERKNG